MSSQGVVIVVLGVVWVLGVIAMRQAMTRLRNEISWAPRSAAWTRSCGPALEILLRLFFSVWALVGFVYLALGLALTVRYIVARM